ncbi:MAG: hypothetical protein JNM94_10245, partial [Phycisphaerae bacterium]|nr:hypothetical protein [Phycisphaerae bacterium]
PVERALSRGLANALGNFSGGVQSVARRAAELGRKAVWAIFDAETLGPARRIESGSVEQSDDAIRTANSS